MTGAVDTIAQRGEAAPAPARPLRVLHVLGSLNRGGVETWLMNVMRRMDPRLMEFHIITHVARRGAYDEEARALGARVMVCTSYRRPFQYARHLAEFMHDDGPYDAVHSHVHWFSGTVLRAASKAGVPVRIAHSHNDTAAVDAAAPVHRRAYLWLMRRWINRHATLALACSRVAGAALFGGGWGANPRDVYLPYGIDLGPFASIGNRAALAAGLGIPPTAKVIGHVGRFDPQKNHRRLVEIAAALLRRDPGVRLVLVGDGPLRPEVEAQVRTLSMEGQVVFAGLRGDVPALMTGLFDTVLFPSLYEGLPVAMIEAQAAGVPVVMSDAITDEVVKSPDRVTRLPLTAPDASWVQAVARWLDRRDEPRPTFDQRAAALREFDVAGSVARLESVYASGARRV